MTVDEVGRVGCRWRRAGGVPGARPAQATQALGAHQALDGAPGHWPQVPGDAGAVEDRVHLAYPEHAVAHRPGAPDQLAQGLVPLTAGAGRAGPGGPVAAGGDLHAGLVQDRADRPGSQVGSVVLEELVGQMLGRPASAAKKAEAPLRVSLALRSSRSSAGYLR